MVVINKSINKYQLIILSCMGLLFCLTTPANGQEYGGGTGETDTPYLIYTAEQMNAIGTEPNDWNNHFILMDNIDLGGYTGTQFNIIGIEDKPFTGVFDGNNLEISNFSYTSTEADYIGLFGEVNDDNAEIKNVRLINPQVNAGRGSRVGALVGKMSHGTISNCYARGGKVCGLSIVGGLVGFMGTYGSIAECNASCTIKSARKAGGLIGYSRGTISNCFATGDVEATDTSLGYAGGLVGSHLSSGVNGLISKCFATGNVAGVSFIGGLVGENLFGASIAQCHASGSVTGSIAGGLVGHNFDGLISHTYSTGRIIATGENVGGLVGLDFDNRAHSSYWNITTSNCSISAGGIGIPTNYLQSESMYYGWDFDNVWGVCEGWNYPKLLWEMPEIGDFGCSTNSGVDLVNYAFLISHWLEDGCNSTSFGNRYCHRTDLNQSGEVNLVDLSIFMSNWLKGINVIKY